MTLTLTLTPERETRLQEIADRDGLSLDELALRALDDLVASDLPALRTGADVIAFWEKSGAFLPDDGSDSVEEARRRRAEAWRR